MGAMGCLSREFKVEAAAPFSENRSYDNRVRSVARRHFLVIRQIGLQTQKKLPAPKEGVRYKINNRKALRFCRGISVPRSSGRRWQLSSRN